MVIGQYGRKALQEEVQRFLFHSKQGFLLGQDAPDIRYMTHGNIAYGPEGPAYLSDVAGPPFFLFADEVVPKLSAIFTIIPVCAFKLEPHVVCGMLPAEDLKMGVDQT